MTDEAKRWIREHVEPVDRRVGAKASRVLAWRAACAAGVAVARTPFCRYLRFRFPQQRVKVVDAD